MDGSDCQADRATGGCADGVLGRDDRRGLDDQIVRADWQGAEPLGG